MDVSCRSPGSNSCDPLRPNSSQPLRNTVRLSCYAHKSNSSWEYIILLLSGFFGANCALFLWHSQRTLPTSPAIGVGSLLIFFTSPGFIALRSLDSEQKMTGFNSFTNMDSLIIPSRSTEVDVMSGTYSHNRMPFSRPLRKPLSPKLLGFECSVNSAWKVELLPMYMKWRRIVFIIKHK